MPGQTTVDGIKMVTVEILLGMVDYEVDIPGKFSRRRQGVCCGFLDRQEIGTELEFLTVHRVSSMLKMPCNPYKVIPVIMVSTGSGAHLSNTCPPSLWLLNPKTTPQLQYYIYLLMYIITTNII